MINAYVDGELSPAEAARVAAAVAQHRELAARVAILTRVKAELTACRREPDRSRLPAANTNRRRTLAAAAALASVVAIVFALIVVAPWSASDEAPHWLQSARAVHAKWVRTGIDGKDQNGAPAARAARVASVLTAPWVPDLRAIDLRQIARQQVAAGLPGMVHVGYTGPRGCMVSFLTWPGEQALPPLPQRFGAGADAAWAWRVGEVGYLLLASRMAPERLAVVVEVVHGATLDRTPPSPDAQRQYLASRRTTAPCQT